MQLYFTSAYFTVGRNARFERQIIMSGAKRVNMQANPQAILNFTLIFVGSLLVWHSFSLEIGAAVFLVAWGICPAPK
jgi:hypothetical protein